MHSTCPHCFASLRFASLYFPSLPLPPLQSIPGTEAEGQAAQSCLPAHLSQLKSSRAKSSSVQVPSGPVSPSKQALTSFVYLTLFVLVRPHPRPRPSPRPRLPQPPASSVQSPILSPFISEGSLPLLNQLYRLHTRLPRYLTYHTEPYLTYLLPTYLPYNTLPDLTLILPHC